MKITMDMSSFEVEPDAMQFEEYDGDMMDTGLNPDVGLVCGLQEIEPADDVASAVVAEIVLRKMYSYQH